MKKLKVYTIRLLGLITILLWSSNITFSSFEKESTKFSIQFDKSHHKNYNSQNEKFISQTTDKDNLFKESSEDDKTLDYISFGQSELIWNFFSSRIYSRTHKADYKPFIYEIPLWIQYQRIII